MTCRSCGDLIEPRQRFCKHCGEPVVGGSGNTANTGGGDVHGGLYQVGRDLIVKQSPTTPPAATYEPIPRWRSPFTLALLTWAALIIGVLSLLPLWKIVQPILWLFRSDSESLASMESIGIWVGIFIALVLVFMSVVSMRRLTKYELRVPLMFGWAVSGSNARITIEEIRVGKCPRCGGEMRYYNKLVGENGRSHEKVAKRVPALECRRNSEHWFEVDPAE